MNTTAKIFLVLAATNGLLAVCFGAFGSHGLKDKLPENLLHAWSTAVQYHFYHVFAIAMVGMLIHQGIMNKIILGSGILFGVGLLFFCGSLYWLALGGPRWLGPITPLGGLCFILGWLCLLVSLFQK